MKIKYIVESDGNDPIEIMPYGGSDSKLSWDREDERRYDFKKEIDDLVLIKEDFRTFYALEKDQNRCNLQTLKVLLFCGINTEPFVLFTGTFSMSAGKWDLDRCTVTFKVETLDPYTCIDQNDDEHNFLELENPQTVSLGINFGTEAFSCKVSGDWPMPSCNYVDIENGQWTFVKEIKIKQLLLKATINIYARNYILVDCDYEPSSDWLLIEACDNGVKKYVRGILGAPPDVEELDINTGEVTLAESAELNEVDNGRKLFNVMQYLLDLACPDGGLTIVSDFFQWNPENETFTNYVTQELNKLTNLIIFQKSDVKRAHVSGNATKAMVSFDDLLEQIIKTFNLGYRIIENDFRIEHISWFEQDLGINLVHVDKKNLLKGTRQYSYDASRLPKFEKFKFMESGSVDFVGTDIIYDSNCVNNDEENKSDNNVDKITTDVMYCLSNPERDGDVSDDGFVIMACDENNNILSEAGILEPNTIINNVLGWAHLHIDYWMHGRVLSHGIMNDVLTEFLSTVPTIKQDQFSVIMPCGLIEFFDPLDLVKGSLGYGFVESAELKLSQCVMTFELMLDKIDLTATEQRLGDFDGDFSEEFD